MKKTLKVLMAIALFAVVLSIATGVSAKTFTQYVDDKVFVLGGEIGGIKNYTIDATKVADIDTIEVTTGAVQLDLSGETLDKDITIEKGAKLVISGEGTILSKIINKGTLVLQGDLTVTTMKVTNAGRVEVRTKDGETPALADNSITLTSSTAEVISAVKIPDAVKAETDTVASKVGYYILKNKAESKTIFAYTPLLSIDAYVVNSTGDKVTKLEEDTVYEVVIKGNYTFDGKSYEIIPWLPVLNGSTLSDEDFAKIETTLVANPDYAGAQKLTFKIGKDLVGKAFTLDIGGRAMNGKVYEYTVKKVAVNGAVVPTTEPTATAEPTATPARDRKSVV